MCFALRKFTCFVHRRCLALMLALAYVMATVGAPCPTSSGTRDATPFPCQGHRCGCLSAEQCWAHCCCFTPQQRLAWAAANGVEAPAELVAVLSGDAQSDDDEHEHLAAGDHRHVDPSAAGDSCCHKHAEACAQSAAPGAVKDKKTAGHGFQAFKCHGISTMWVTTGAVAAPFVPVAWTIDRSIVGTVPAMRCSLTVVSFLPEVPPPRAAARPPASAAV
ncbi:MAG TPA: hypothetical protein VHY91_07285 [Pirellulales bacterium]|jgi:hypothetical protein|nr:hypothetical protein [Pirellulales bacterium]